MSASRCRKVWTCSIAMAAIAVGLVVRADADLGRWTSKGSMGTAGDAIAVHLALLPDDGSTYHSRILWWNNSGAGKNGLWGWQPGNAACLLGPTSGFTPLTPPSIGADIFCSAHSHLADGGFQTFGGNEWPEAFGIADSRRYSGSGANSGVWTPKSTMSQQRWYGSATMTHDGRVVVTSGTKYWHFWSYGGRRNGSEPAGPSGDSLQRFGATLHGHWDPPVKPIEFQGRKPGLRKGHTAVTLDIANSVPGQVLFGGQSGAELKNDVWFLKASLGAPNAADNLYEWSEPTVGGEAPPVRYGHTAVAISSYEMIVFGGAGASGGFNDLRRLWRDQLGAWRWQAVTINGGTPPSARHGHTAIWDPTSRRMIFYGGAESATSPSPIDEKVYAFTFSAFDGSSGSWSQFTPNSVLGQPGTRYGHSMVLDDTLRTDTSLDDVVTGRPAFMFGGEARGGTYPDTLWALWIGTDWVKWKPTSLTDVYGHKPTGRSHHACVWEDGFDQLFIHGGEVAGGASADNGQVYSVYPWGEQSWMKNWFRTAGPLKLSRHTMLAAPPLSNLARIPEIYDPASNTWSAEPAAALFQLTYPLNFAIPGGSSVGGRLFTTGAPLLSGGVRPSYSLDVPSAGQALPAWQPHTNLDPGFTPTSGVQYRPGKILIAGGTSSPTSATVVGTTRKVDTSNLSTAQWSASSNDMEPRYRHNLVVLPNGEVLAAGGVGTTDILANSPAKKRPQIWNPDAAGGAGAWTSVNDPATQLAQSDAVRGYHSTAILLPDGRVLCAGGNGHADQTFADVFCPPYLFNGDGSAATRPVLEGSPQRVRYGHRFSVCTPYYTNAQSPCIIRPASTTHSFDENQRFVPLTFTTETADYGSRLIVTAPSDSSAAPPGDYMLFVLGTNGTPAIARWIRLGSQWSPADAVAPAAIPDFAPEIVTPSSITLTWTAPGDDGGNGVASQYELRYSTSPIDTTQLYLAGPVPQMPVPACPNALQSYTLTGLQGCTWYYFAIRTSDDKGNLSAIRLCQVRTLCGGGGGGGESATEVRIEAGMNHGPQTRPATASAIEAGTLAANGAVVVATADGQTERGWKINRLADGAVAPIGVADSSAVELQRLGAGGWMTYARLSGVAGPIGLLGLRGDARALLAPGTVLDRVARATTGFAISACTHSRFGAVTGDTETGEFAPTLENGDSVTVVYQNSPTASPDLGDCFFTFSPNRGASSFSGRRVSGESDPSRTAARSFSMKPGQPNPFETEITIEFELPEPASVQLEVFDLLGRRVRTILNARLDAGLHKATWDRRDAGGRRVEAGVYYSRLTAGHYRFQEKMLALP